MVRVCAETLPKYNFIFYCVKWRSLSILRHCDERSKSYFRRLERNLKQVYKAGIDQEFNEICKENCLLPNYSKLRLHDEEAQQEQRTIDFRQHLVDRQIQHASEEGKRRLKEFVKLLCGFRKTVSSSFQFFSLLFCLFRLCDQYVCVEKLKQNKKLNTLYGGKILRREKFCQVVNCSKYVLDADELDVET